MQTLQTGFSRLHYHPSQPMGFGLQVEEVNIRQFCAACRFCTPLIVLGRLPYLQLLTDQLRDPMMMEKCLEQPINKVLGFSVRLSAIANDYRVLLAKEEHEVRMGGDVF